MTTEQNPLYLPLTCMAFGAMHLYRFWIRIQQLEYIQLLHSKYIQDDPSLTLHFIMTTSIYIYIVPQKVLFQTIVF